MKFNIKREVFLQPLTQVIGVVERRQTLPVLANFLLIAREGQISVTGTDMEVELVSSVSADVDQEGEITVPARKILDIVKALPDGAQISLTVSDEKATLVAGKSRYTLATLPAAEFPATDEVETVDEVVIAEKALKNLIDRTAFAMANNDVRYYLNGMLFDFTDGKLRVVATDGHRLAVSDHDGALDLQGDRQMIVPRKGVLELSRMLGESDDEVSLALGRSHVRLSRAGTRFTSKLIDGRFPDYQAVIPVGADKQILVDREIFANALHRAAILSNEKYKGVRLDANGNMLKIIAHNPQHEEAVEEIEVDLNFDALAVGFNVTYLQDALSALDTEQVSLELKDPNSSCLVSAPDSDLNRHVVMPLKL